MKKLAVLNLVLVLSLMLGAVAFAAEDIQAAAYDYFSGGTKNITADVVYDNLNDGDDTNNPYIVSVRKQEDYEQAHIPTAVWMDAKTLFTADNLAKLPTDKQIVVYCYTGQTASQVVWLWCLERGRAHQQDLRSGHHGQRLRDRVGTCRRNEDRT